MMTKKKRVSVQHFLLTFDLGGGHLHGYLMAPDRRYVLEALNRMTKIAEQYPRFLPIVLSTDLDTGVDVVREIIAARFEQAAQTFTEPHNYHFTAWVLPKDDPDDKRLMELH